MNTAAKCRQQWQRKGEGPRARANARRSQRRRPRANARRRARRGPRASPRRRRDPRERPNRRAERRSHAASVPSNNANVVTLHAR